MNQHKTQPKEYREVLEEVAKCPDFWVKVHAIEFLEALGYTDEARQAVIRNLEGADALPQKRVGYWRCRFRLATSPEEKKGWLEKIANAYRDKSGPDRIHAAETLAKLGHSLRNLDPATVAADRTGEGALSAYVTWGYAIPAGDDSVDYELLFNLLDSGDPGTRRIGAYGLGFIRDFPNDRWERLAGRALAEPAGSEAYPYLIGTAFALSAKGSSGSRAGEIKKRLMALGETGKKESRIEMCRALAVNGNPDDTEKLKSWLRGEDLLPETGDVKHPANLDVQAAAAFALMCIEKRGVTPRK